MAKQHFSNTSENTTDQMPFGTINFLGLVIGILTIVLGFILMAMDSKFTDATEFSVSLHVAPVLIILGYAVVAVAIMLKPKRKNAAA